MREVIDRQPTERGEVQLQRRGEGVYEIIYNGVFLIASHNHRSERALAKSVFKRLVQRIGGYQILIGGLGMGFTLQEVLACPEVSHAVVIEIEGAIIDWNRGCLSELNDRALDDPRIVLTHCDLFDFLYQTRDRFDAILIDVDNGPSWLALEKNGRLYSEKALRKAKEILTESGILATWSAQKEVAYLRKLKRVFPQTEEIRVEETTPKEGESWIYIGMT